MKIDPPTYFILPLFTGMTAMMVFDGSPKALVVGAWSMIVVLLVVDIIGHRRKKS